VKGKKEDKELNDLFRHKLENAEVIPSPSVSKALMRKLARREFLRFNPARINIWYTGGAVIAGAALVLILTYNNRTENEQVSSGISTGIDRPVTTNNRTTEGAGMTDIKQADNDRSVRTKSTISTEKKTIVTEEDKGVQKYPEKTRIVVQPTEMPALPEVGLLKDKTNEKDKLQGVARHVDNLISASVTEGCIPLKVVFKNRSLAYDSCKWIFGDGGYSHEKNPEWLFDIEGEYEVILRVFGQGGRQSFSSVLIKVHPRPSARFEISPENAVIPDNEITFLNYSVDAEGYRWDFGDGSTSDLIEPRHSYSRYGNYNVRLIAISAYGCADSLVVRNAFGSGYYVRFPNAFIPNPEGPSGGYYSNSSDEFAYVFHPSHSGVSEYQLRIFSRRGILIYETNDVNIGWDGYYKGQLSEPGVYIWKVRGNYINGEPFTLMGDVTLLKTP
jgi:PKD repeat protein